MAEEQQKFFDVCGITLKKLNDTSDNIIKKEKDVTIKEIKEYLETYKIFDDTCMIRTKNILQKRPMGLEDVT